ncbi:MAG: hypothetical protein J7M39_01620 [Anaerolineae bacterium]|nr:hypothetical protein [Anaerolineae bacterium]
MDDDQPKNLSEASLRLTSGGSYHQLQSSQTPTRPKPEQMTSRLEARPKRRVIPRLWNVFKNIAILFSFLVNIVLVIVVAILVLRADSIFSIKTEVAEPLLLDLDQAFAALGESTIQSTIYITDTIPVVFDIPLEQNTDVILTQPVPLNMPAQFMISGGGGTINGTVTMSLPQGQALPVVLRINVPVSTTVPVIVDAPVTIDVAEAGMGPAIEQLRAVFRPMTSFVQSLPDSAEELLQPND